MAVVVVPLTAAPLDKVPLVDITVEAVEAVPPIPVAVAALAQRESL